MTADQDLGLRPAASAVISDDGVYRYLLTRTWDEQLPTLRWIMLNPSTADATVDDPTIRRCRGFARQWGYGSLEVANLYALRATDPKALRAHPHPFGPDNAAWLEHTADTRDAYPVIAAWGAHADPAHVRGCLAGPLAERDLWCLGRTLTGAPRHPLYIPATAELERWQ